MNQSYRVFKATAVALLFIGLSGARAQEVATIPVLDFPLGTPGLGAGVRVSGSPYDAKDSEIDLIPLYLYEGRYFFGHGTKFGLHALNSDAVSLDLLVRYDFRKLQPESDPLFSGINERKQTWQGGIGGQVRGNWGSLRAEYVQDILNRHQGRQFDLSYRYVWKVRDWVISPYLTGNWLDDKTTNYYYGVSASESAPGRPAYTPGAAFNFGWGVNTSYRLTDNIFMFGNLGSTGYDSSITRSPLVAENTAYTAFFGAGYLFGDDLKKDRFEKGPGKTSYRATYGYQAERNIFPLLMGGNIEKSKRADTNLAGFTVGRLFQEGDRAQYWGKFAVYRHIEEPLQDDFWSFNFFMMAIGKGYFPWSEKLAFRYGFGLGFSYAQEVPIAEQLKQEAKGENTNRFLNYLEFMFDVPVDRYIQSKWAKDCYLGVTIAHRSGIFATSDILGSVAGGSDWVNLSYECVR